MANVMIGLIQKPFECMNKKIFSDVNPSSVLTRRMDVLYGVFVIKRVCRAESST